MRPQALGARQPLGDHVQPVEENLYRSSPITRPPAIIGEGRRDAGGERAKASDSCSPAATPTRDSKKSSGVSRMATRATLHSSASKSR